MTEDVSFVKLDRMRFTKDKLSSGLALAAIAADIVYFVSVYKSDVGSYYYDWVTGASVIYNLLFMLAAFLASEGVKSRKSGYSALLIAIGAMQIARIFFLPMRAYNAVVQLKGQTLSVMSGAQFNLIAVMLILSGALCIAAGIISFSNRKRLREHMTHMASQQGKKEADAWQG